MDLRYLSSKFEAAPGLSSLMQKGFRKAVVRSTESQIGIILNKDLLCLGTFSSISAKMLNYKKLNVQ